MKSLNSVNLVGNIGNEIKLQTSQSSQYCQISIATSEEWKDKVSGEKKEKAEWHRVVFFGKSAEILSKYCKKGDKIWVSGALSTRKYNDKQGLERYTTEIIGKDFIMLGSNRAASNETQESNFNVSSNVSNVENYDDIPF